MPNSTKTCPKCGLQLGTDALCARCLLNANFGSVAEAQPTATGVPAENQGAEPAPEPIGAIIDRKYRIERNLGKGGMGTVFLATHLGTKRQVALKLISAEWTLKPEFQRRFQREAETLGRVRHPNVVNVTDFGIAWFEGRDMAYLVMEYLDGVTLAEHLSQSGPLSVRLVLDIIDQVASALDTAHAVGVVHRDLKPENIWVEPNRLGGFNVRVLDFGIAKLAQATPPPPEMPLNQENAPTVDMQAASFDAATEDPRTQRGRILGTPAYMSPEQCRGEALDGRSDVYSLGVIAFLLLAGELPYTGSSAELIRKHVHEPPPPLYRRRPGVSRAISQTVAAALEKDPADRPRTASAFASMLRTNAECERSLLPRGRRLTSGVPSIFFCLLFLHFAVAGTLGAFLLVGLVNLRLSPFWLDCSSAAGMMAILLITGNGIMAAWAIVLQEVLSRQSFDVRVVTVLIAYARKVPNLVLNQALSVLKIAPLFTKTLWPVVCIFEPPVPSAERSIVLTGAIRNISAALTIRWVVFAVLAAGYSVIVVPSIMMSHGGGDSWQILTFEAALASLMFTLSSMATLATFPFFYLRARSIRGEAAEPTLPATDTPEFPANRIPALTRATKLWIAAGILIIGVSTYARVSGTSPEYRKTAESLKSAVELGKVRTVEKLVAAGADVNSRYRPWTPLTRATLFGQEPVVDILLKAGVNVNFHDPDVGTAVYLAAAGRQNSILTKLLDHSADPNTAPVWGLTPLMVAATQGNEQAVRVLLAHGADPNRRTPQGLTAVDLAKEQGQTGVIALLMNGR